jgi:hypothetical protein
VVVPVDVPVPKSTLAADALARPKSAPELEATSRLSLGASQLVKVKITDKINISFFIITSILILLEYT